MANFSNLKETLENTVSNSSTSTVASDIPVKSYESISVVVRADSSHDFELQIERDGLDDTGTYGSSDGGTSTSLSSQNNQIASISNVNIESPKINVKVNNKDSSNHDYDVYVGGQSK